MFEGENFHKYRGFRAISESVSVKSRAVTHTIGGTSNPRMFSQQNFPPINENFLPHKFLLYSTCCHVILSHLGRHLAQAGV